MAVPLQLATLLAIPDTPETEFMLVWPWVLGLVASCPNHVVTAKKVDY